MHFMLQWKCPITFLFWHVKEHQDQLSNHTLDEWALLNIMIYKKAKEQWAVHQTHKCTLIFEPWQIILNGHQLTQQLTHTIQSHCNSATAINYWHHKNPTQFHHMVPVITKEIMLAYPIQCCWWIAKHTAGICNVQHCLHIWDQASNNHCPQCNKPETAKHVWSCQGSQSNAVWDQSMRALEEDLATFRDGCQTQFFCWDSSPIPNLNLLASWVVKP